jgi:DNA-binding transcriptional ArsR family regulator
MGVTKIHLHSIEANQIAAIAKVFAHPARVAILQYISKQENCICTDIAEEVGLSQPTVSQHLAVIKEAGLLRGNHKGKSICYCLNKKNFDQFALVFEQFFKETLLNCC